MGFNFTKTSDSSCVFIATAEGANVEQFVLCVQKALKNLLLDITIDLATSPKSLGEVLPHVIKLQKLLTQHQRALTLVGLKVTAGSEFVQSLKTLGINILENPTMQTARSVIHESLDLAGTAARHGVGEAGAAATGAQPSGVLPSAEEIEIHFDELRKTFGRMLTEKASLQGEKRSYEQRIHALKTQDHSEASVYDQAQIQNLVVLEHELMTLKEAVDALHLQITAEEKNFAQVENNANETLGKKIESFQKEKQTIDKQLTDLNRVHEKIKAEFKKKSDNRREKLGHG